MIISVNWLEKFVPNLPEIGELSRLIGARLVEIESVENLGEKYKDVIIARVVSAEKVAGSNHLNLCKIDDGGVRAGVNRDENGFVQVVCGAPNMRAGLFVAWLPPEAIVPETFGTDDEFKLGARKLMGNMSNGMIASLRELGLGDEHDGILEISPDEFGGNLNAGDSFSEKFELNDYLLEVENKSLTHRPDCFGIIGFAREVAGILGQKFENPAEFTSEYLMIETQNPTEKIAAEIQNPELCQFYGAIVLDVENVKKQGEFSVRSTYLLRSGMRPIDAIVDLANRIMLTTGQPLHTFDYDKLKALNGGKEVKMTVRNALDGEELTLIDGRTIKMAPSDIVIATGENGEKSVALAGAMGGAETEITDETKRILVEAATFNLYNLRNTQMRHGIFSEAITRFTKGQPAGLPSRALYDFVIKIQRLNGEAIGDVAKQDLSMPNADVSVEISKVNQILGANFTAKDIQKTLENVGFNIEIAGEKLTAKVPFWRTDIHIAEDLIEEVGRLNGYDNIALTLPLRTFEAVKKAPINQLQAEIRQILAASGANEVLTYSFIHGDLLKNVQQDSSNSYRIVNSISPDLQFYRQTILPSLLAKVNQNIRAGFDEFAIFEINKTTHKKLGLNAEGVPNENKRLAVAYANKKGENAFYNAKYFAGYLFEKLGVKVEFKPFDINDAPLAGKFEPKRSATIWLENGEFLGAIGEFKKAVSKALKLPEATAGFEIDIEKIVKPWQDRQLKMREFSKFQSVERDFSLRVDTEKPFGEILKPFEQKIGDFKDLQIEITPLDIFKVNDEHKNVAIRFKITPLNKTLNGEEIKQITDELSAVAIENGAQII